MVDFTLWDIFRNLLLAGRWTVALSLIAFVGGGLVGLLLLVLRLSKLPGAQRFVAGRDFEYRIRLRGRRAIERHMHFDDGRHRASSEFDHMAKRREAGLSA